jgi:CheY-like chemotaxis protein
MRPEQALDATHASAGKRVLLVEDNDETASALKMGLEDLGCQVALAHNGPVALQVAKSFEPDICVVDIVLPVMNGYELVKRMREVFNLQSRNVPFVAVTGHTTQFDRQTSLDAGCSDHLLKPLRAAQLLEVIETLIRT